MQKDTKDMKDIPPINNNPFSTTGRIHRLSYFLTSLVFTIPATIISSVAEKASTADAAIGIFGFVLLLCILVLFSAAKRSRDCGYSPYTCLWLLVPFISFVVAILLLFKGSVYRD